MFNKIIDKIICNHIEYRAANNMKRTSIKAAQEYVRRRMEQNKFPYVLFLMDEACKGADSAQLSEFARKMSWDISAVRTSSSRAAGMPDRLISGTTAFSEAQGEGAEIVHGAIHDVFPFEPLNPYPRSTKDDPGDYNLHGLAHDVKATHYSSGCLHLPRWKVGDERVFCNETVVDWTVGNREAFYLTKIDILCLYTGDIRDEIPIKKQGQWVNVKNKNPGLFINRGYISTRAMLTKPLGCLLNQKNGCSGWQSFGHCECESFLAQQNELRPLDQIYQSSRASTPF